MNMTQKKEMQTLKQLRQNAGVTQKELAELFGVTDRTIQYLEKDSSNISNNMIEKYINAFGVTYDEIFLGNEYENFVFNKKRKESILDQLENNLSNSSKIS